MAPVEPVKTRSSSLKQKNDVAVATPSDVSAAATPPSEISLASIQSALETKLDDRMARMETSFRSSITSMMTQTAVPVPSPEIAMQPPPAPAPPAAAAAHHSRRDASAGVSSRTSSASTTRSSSYSSRSSRSSSRSRSGCSRRRHRHRHHRSRSSSHRRSKHSKYSSARYLKENQKLTTYERLVLVDVCMAIALLKRKKDISGYLKHFLMIAEKADKDVFEPKALISYDESVKDMAKESGIGAFAKVEPSLIVKHLSYDGTKNASANKAAKFKKPSNGHASAPRAKTLGYCIKYNMDPSGCPRGKDCPYKHICSACYGSGHTTDNCPNVKKQK